MSNKCDSLCLVPSERTAPYKTINSMETFIWVLKIILFCSSFLGRGKESTNHALCNKCTILLPCCDRQKLSFEEICHMLPIGVKTGYIWSMEYQWVLFYNCFFSEKNLGQFQWTNVLAYHQWKQAVENQLIQTVISVHARTYPLSLLCIYIYLDA